MDSTLPVSEILELSTYFVAPLSMGIHVIFFLFLSENICCGYSLGLAVALLMSTHNIFLVKK